MITRIPQPQFIGPAPSEVVTQAGDNGTRLAQMFQQGVDAAQKNYISQQQIKVEQRKNEISQQEANTGAKNAQTESDRLRFGLMAKDLSDDLQKTGPMSYVNRKNEWLQFFTFESGGDKEAGKALYEGGAGALRQITGVDALRHGLLGVAAQGGQQEAAQSAPAPSGSLSPEAAAAGNYPGSTPPAPAPMSPMQQGANPQGSPTAIGPSGATPVPSGLPQTTAPVTAQPNTPVAQRMGLVLSPEGASAGAMISGSQGAMQGSETSITHATRGLPDNAITRSANSGLAKIAGIAMGNVDPSTEVTPKENAAIRSAMKPAIQVLKNSEVASYLAAGGSDEALQRAAQQLNDALKDPQFAAWLGTANVMSPTDAAEFNKFITADVKVDELARKIQRDADIKTKENTSAALKAFQLQNQFQLGYDRITQRDKELNTKESRLGVDRWRLAIDAVKNFDAVSDKVRDQFLKSKPSASSDEVNEYLKEEFQNPNSSSLSSLNMAAHLVGAAMGVDPQEVTLQLQAQYFLGIPFLPETSPAQQVTVPQIPRAGTPPATPQPRPSGAPAPKPVPPTAAGSLTPAQKARVMAGQPPGNP